MQKFCPCGNWKRAVFLRTDCSVCGGDGSIPEIVPKQKEVPEERNVLFMAPAVEEQQASRVLR